MEKKLQVFVSSTYLDLKEERQKAVEAILEAGHIPAGMELFPAGKSQMETIKKEIDDSDVYCLLLGGRYGSVEEESKLSYTQLEYEYAVSKGMPLFAIVLGEDMLHKKAYENPNRNFFESGENKCKYDKFRKQVGKNIYKEAQNLSEIATHIHSQLNNILRNHSGDLIGWIRANQIDGQPKITEEQKKVQTLDEKIKRMPQSVQLYMERAELLLSLDSSYLQRVIQDYLYVILFEPKCVKAYYKLIETLANATHYDEALRLAEETCRLFPDEAKAYAWRAHVKYSQMLYREGIEDCDKAISIQSYSWFYVIRGCCYHGLNRYSDALEDFARAYKLNADYKTAVTNVKLEVKWVGVSKVIQTALEEKKNGDYEKSKLYFECVLLAEPNNEKTLQEYGKLYYDMKKYTEALEQWEKALKINKSCQNYYICAIAYRSMSEHSRAVEYGRSALAYADDGYYEMAKAMLEKYEN